MESNTQNKIIIISQPAQVDMADDWYEFATLDHFWIQARFDAIKRVSNIKNNLTNCKLFEIGCGSGLIMRQFETLSNVLVDGCDLNLIALKKISGVKGNIYSLNIYDKPSELIHKYNGILLMDVIEHINDDSDFLNNSCTYLQEGGLVIINVPALNSLFSKYDVMAGHKRRYTKKMLEDLFVKNQIEKISIEYWGLLLVPIAIIRKFILKFMPDDKIIKKGFKPPHQFLNYLLNKLMKLENTLFKSVPIGTSIVAIGRVKTLK